MKLNKKKGFTLIELLAVIVVLAIIALIATPIVMNTIEKSKKGAAIESANNLIKSAEYYILQTKSRYGKVSVLDEKLNYSGNKPDLGEVEINKDGKSRIYTYLNGYCVTKDYENETPYATKTSKEECNWFATDNYETKEESIIVSNNRNVKNYLIYGNSTQETRSGKNILNMANFTTSYTNSYFKDKATNFKLTAGKTYTLSFNYRVLSAGATLSTGVGYGTKGYSADIVYGKAYPDQTTGRQSVTFTVPSNLADGNYLFVRFARTGSATSASVAISSIQLEEGSTVTEYEPYGAMPSPEFPSEINNTGDLITKDNCASYGSNACNNVGKYVIPVKVSGKNIFDYDNVSTSYGVKKQDNGYYTSNMSYNMISTYQTLKHYIGKDQKVTVSFDLTTSEDGTFLIYPYQTNGIGIRFTTISKEMKANTKTRITATGKVEVLGTNPAYSLGEIIIYKNGYKGSYLVNNIQFEVGEQATDYEAYNGKTTNIYLDEPLRKIGDYVDYIDYANSKVVRNIRKLVFNGKEGWWKNGDYGDYVSFYVTTSIGDFKPINGLGYSNMATVASWNNIQKTNGNYWWHFLPTSYGMRINKNYLDNYDSATTDGARVTLFKNWLKSHNVEVIQVLKTPKEESIKLPEIQTVEGINYITVNTTTCASNLKITTNK